MNLLGAKLYDPTSAATKATTSLLAMTAIDTTNLRIAFTVPAHGFVHVKLSCVHHGSTTAPQLMLGVLEGSTVRARVSPSFNLLQTAIATSQICFQCDFTVPGMTPGAINWDAAYGVEIVSSAGGAIKYGGPNNTTTNDNFGAFVFEVWDPQPLKTGLDGGVNTTQWLGTAAATPTVAGVPEVDVTHWIGTAAATPTVAGVPEVDVTHLVGVAQSATDLKDFADDGYDPSTNKVQGVVLTDTVTTYTGNTVQTGDSFARIGAAGAGLTAIDLPNQTMDITGNITGNLSGSVGSVTGAVGSVTGAVGSVTGAVGSVTGAVGSVTGNVNGNVVGSVGSVTGLTASNLDATVSSRATQASVDTIDGIVDAILVDTAEIGVAGAGLTAINLPDQTMDITGNLSGSVGSVTGLTAANLDATVSSRLAAAAYTAPDNTGIGDTLAAVTDPMTESYAALAAEGTLAQVLYEIRALLMENSVSGTTVTIKKLDGTTTAATFTINNAATPTAITRAT